jgi:hypothetical protein
MVSDATKIEKVGVGQSQHSGVQQDDILIAVNQYDLVGKPAKMAVRVLSLLSFPKILG